MNEAVRGLENLKAFLSDRPRLTKKMQEVFDVLGVVDYKSTSPIIKNINVYGGNKYYDDNGKAENNGYVRSDAELQEFTFAVGLTNEKAIYVKVLQKKYDYKLGERAYYSDSSYGGVKGKANIITILTDALEKHEKGDNPFQKELDVCQGQYDYSLNKLNEYKAEMAIIEPLKEKLEFCYFKIRSEVSSYEYNVSNAKEKLELVQSKVDGTYDADVYYA